MFVHDTLLNLHVICIEFFVLQQTRYVGPIWLLVYEVRVVVEIRI